MVNFSAHFLCSAVYNGQVGNCTLQQGRSASNSGFGSYGRCIAMEGRIGNVGLGQDLFSRRQAEAEYTVPVLQSPL